jgi:hypothetical protein
MESHYFVKGSYNRCFRVKFDNGQEVIVRLSALGFQRSAGRFFAERKSKTKPW